MVKQNSEGDIAPLMKKNTSKTLATNKSGVIKKEISQPNSSQKLSVPKKKKPIVSRRASMLHSRLKQLAQMNSNMKDGDNLMNKLMTNQVPMLLAENLQSQPLE